MQNRKILAEEIITQNIYLIRGKRVMIDMDLARLYRVPTKRLNEAVKRNKQRFPADFMFQLSLEETNLLNRSQFATGSQKHRNIKFLPFVFTEQGIAMLSSVLNSKQAIGANIAIMRAFVKLREILLTNEELSRKIMELEVTYDGQFKTIFAVIKKLLSEPTTKITKIGFDQSRSR